MTLGTRTKAKELRGRCYYRKGMWHWDVRDADGKKLAYGEDKKLEHVWQNAHDVVFAVQVWTMFGRYKLFNPSGKLCFETEPVRRQRNPNFF